MPKVGICHLCGEEKPLCKAHLLPKFFIKLLKSQNKQSFVELTDMDLKKANDKQDSMFDTNILCASCDNTFSASESYSKLFLEEKFGILKIQGPKREKDRGADYLYYENVDVRKIKIFVLATIWRLSISKLKQHRDIDLGPLNKIVREFLINLNPGDAYFFPFYLISLKKVNDLRRKFISSPLSLKMNGKRVITLHIYDYVLMIELTKNGRSGFMSTTSIIDEQRLFVVELESKFGIEYLDSMYGRKIRRLPLI